jgi:hypothetical protein
MEHRKDLEELLLDGLPQGERQHVVDAIKQTTARTLADKRSQDQDTVDAGSGD